MLNPATLIRTTPLKLPGTTALNLEIPTSAVTPPRRQMGLESHFRPSPAAGTGPGSDVTWADAAGLGEGNGCGVILGGNPRNRSPLPPGSAVARPKDCFRMFRGADLPPVPGCGCQRWRPEGLAGGRSGIRKCGVGARCEWCWEERGGDPE